MKSFVFRAALAASLALFGVWVSTAQSNAKTDETTIRDMEKRWDAAAVKGDIAAFEQLLADHFINTGGDGKVQTRPEFLADLKSGKLKFLSAQGHDLQVLLYGDGAVVTGLWNGKVIDHGKTTDGLERYTASYARQNGRWRCTSSHSSMVTK